MKQNSRLLQISRVFDEKGYALPFALFVLVIFGLFLSTGLFLAQAIQERVNLRIDVLHARDLVYAGINSEISLLLNDNHAGSIHFQNSDGVCDVNGKKLTSTSRFYTLSASAVTIQGAKSTATVIFDPITRHLTFWNESP